MSQENQSAVTPWKPEDAVKNLKERIRLEFAAMIPAEQFAEMVRVVINDFLKAKQTGYGPRDRCSDFDKVVVDELTAATKEEVQKFLNSPAWKAKWDADLQRNSTSDAISEILEKKGPAILNSWLAQAISQVVQGMQIR